MLSAACREQLRAPIEEALGGDAVELVALEEIAADASQQVDAAFISRDITGKSSKSVASQALSDCHAVLRRSANLCWVHTHSAGADRPIYAELRERGVRVSTSSGANAQIVAHSALAGLLALARRLPDLLAAQARREWSSLANGSLPRDLAGQTAVLVGWGPIARALQPLLAALGLRTIVVRHSAASAGPGIETHGFAQLSEMLPRADWLVLACPLTAQTRALIGAPELRRLPPGAHLINVARGEVVVQDALVEALRCGQLAGACLDVFEHEPLPPASPLWVMPRVIVTPHSAGHSDGNAARVADIFVANLRRWRRGEALLNAVP
ncbi:MAG: D-2-hydroxyacid dehydrogenase [Burkholderiaceae bacterium]|jgi:phosphoglycerate dehydrogenase-like enzyme|nr:D-2-hydroxyacid dehydrogenase [Burkholderiaceae bacterium]MCU0963529.1 D-2-hydroxyacid dehydrogenase [Burkholderiaceae bacterium]